MIKVEHIRKEYGDVVAVKDLSFTVEKGTVYGFLGANGAGKTTTLSILTGCLAPDSGSVTIDGLDIFEQAAAAKKKIGYLPEIPPLYPDMTPLEHLFFICDAKRIPKAQRDDEIRKVIRATNLQPVVHRLTKNLSKGYKQRVGLAGALLGEPDVLILDEPTVGLDPMQIIEIRDLVKEYGKEHTVILSSHILSEIELICDKVLILSHGVMVAEDTPASLREQKKGHLLELSVRGEREAIEKVLGIFQGRLSIEQAEKEEDELHLTLSYDPKEDLRPELFFAFADARLPILSMSRRQVSLEQIFLELNDDETTLNEKGETPR